MGSRARGGGGWPTLTGSEKQISWANDIRNGAQGALQYIKENAPGMTKEGKALLSKWETKMKGMTKASEWIDSRWSATKTPTKVSAGDKTWETKYNQGQAKSALSQFAGWLGT
jgi:hypothetical protein